MTSISDFNHVESPLLRRLLTHWLDLKGSDEVPLRSSLDPVDIAWVLPKVWLMRLDRDVGLLRYILAGDEIQAMFGQSLARRVFADFLKPDLAEFLEAKFARVIEEPAVCHDIGPVYVNTERPGTGERLVVPFAADGGEVEFMLGCTVYAWSGVVRTPVDSRVHYSTTYTPLRPD